MTNILLISEDYIKTNSNLNDNVWGDYLLPAIREAEDIGLQSILGSCLYAPVVSAALRAGAGCPQPAGSEP